MPTTDQIWLSDICHVCTRDVIRTYPSRGRARTCTPCLRIDRALGARHGAALLTPVDDAWADGERVALNRLDGPGRDDGGHGRHDHVRTGAAAEAVAGRMRAHAETAAERMRAHHVRRVAAMSEAIRAATGVAGAPRWPGGPNHARVIHLDLWQDHFPPGPTASAAGYVEYVAAVHPWALAVEPLCGDAEALTQLAIHR